MDLDALGQVSSGAVQTPNTDFIQNSLTDLVENAIDMLVEDAIDTENLLANSYIARSQGQQGGNG